MSTDQFRYDLLVQEALRDVVRRVLVRVAKDGFPGDHHAYISFRTDAPNVRISDRVRKEYPEEITIVLQHQFWDLTVTETSFDVGLSFSNIPERLHVPFDAITGFFDPSVQFGLKFEVQELGPDVGANDLESSSHEPASVTPIPLKKGKTDRSTDKKDGIVGKKTAKTVKSGDELDQATEGDLQTEAPEATKENTETETTASPPTAADENNVVSIDAFRKKP